MKKALFIITIFVFLIPLSTSTAFAGKLDDDSSYPWQSHRAPFDFQFGNMIDTHQQSKLKKEKLQGFIYIHYTGEYTEDGIPIARKADCYNEECSVGWVIKGIPYTGTLVNKGPRIWQIEPDGLPKELGYTHFHWEGGPQKPHGLTVGNSYNGYLLKRVAVTTFYWLGGSNGQGGSEGNGGTGGCGSDDGGCSGDDHTDDGCSSGGGEIDSGCSGDDHTEGGCSGSGGSSGHGGRLVLEGLDSHSNIVTDWDGTWNGCGSDD